MSLLRNKQTLFREKHPFIPFHKQHSTERGVLFVVLPLTHSCPARRLSRTASWWVPSPTSSSTTPQRAMASSLKTCWTWLHKASLVQKGVPRRGVNPPVKNHRFLPAPFTQGGLSGRQIAACLAIHFYMRCRNKAVDGRFVTARFYLPFDEFMI